MTDRPSAEDQEDYEGSRADWLFETLRDEILSGALPPGAKISEPKVARRFNMSRGPIREAIRRLEERQLVTRTPRLGARVVSVSVEDFIDLVNIREVLEGLACRLAAEHMSQLQIDELRRLVDERLTDLRHETSEFTSADQSSDFHSAIARGSGNPELERLLCKDYFYRFRLVYQQQFWTPAIGQKGEHEHQRIIDAIEARDGELAEILMRRHIKAGLKRYLSGAQSNLENALASDATSSSEKFQARHVIDEINTLLDKRSR